MDMRHKIEPGKAYDDVSGWICAHNDLTGCKFGKAIGTNFVLCTGENIDFARSEIAGSTFEKCSASVLGCLIGATWNGTEITRVSGWLVFDELYWCFATNAFVQIGCMQKSWADWLSIGTSRESLAILHQEQPRIDLDATWEWWTTHKANIQYWIDTCGKNLHG